MSVINPGIWPGPQPQFRTQSTVDYLSVLQNSDKSGNRLTWPTSDSILPGAPDGKVTQTELNQYRSQLGQTVMVHQWLGQYFGSYFGGNFQEVTKQLQNELSAANTLSQYFYQFAGQDSAITRDHLMTVAKRDGDQWNVSPMDVPIYYMQAGNQQSPMNFMGSGLF